MEKQNFKPPIKIVQRQEYVTSVLSTQSFDFICKNSRFIREELMYFLKYEKYLSNYRVQNTVDTQLKQCMKALMTLLKSLNQEKYQGQLPIFNHILSKYEIFMKKSQENILLINKSKIHTRIQKNEQSKRYTFYQKSADSYQQIQKKNHKINQFFYDVNSNQIILQDPQCILCTPIFIQDFEIQNNNPYISYVIGINYKKTGISELSLQKYVNSVCIQGGGAILIGVQKKQNSLKVKGIRFKSLEEADKVQAQIQMAIKNIRPSCHYYVEKVVVHSNYMDYSPANVSLEVDRYCFRIFVRPIDFNRMHYVQIKRKHLDSAFEFYQLNSQKQPSKIQPIHHYSKIHGQYYSQLSYSFISSHRNISCTRRYNYYSKIFSFLNSQGLIERSQITSEQQFEEQNSNENKIRFKYSNLSLILVNPKKQNQYIQELKKSLKESKEVFDIIRPFPESFQEYARSPWIISHQVTHSRMKTLINKFKGKNDNASLYSISKIIEVPHSKFTRNMEQTLAKKINSIYKKKLGETMDHKKHEVKQIYYLKFDDVMESVYAYMGMDSLNIKPYFSNEEECKIIF